MCFRTTKLSPNVAKTRVMYVYIYIFFYKYALINVYFELDSMVIERVKAYVNNFKGFD